MEFRIGINLGGVIVEGEQIYGDGVNIAARLEGLAEPGGICISGTAYDQLEGKLALAYTFKGERTVRNIAKPVRVYRVHMDSEGKASRVHVRRRESLPLRRLAATFAVTLLILAGGVTGWHLLVRSPLLVTATRAPEATALPLLTKPSIAVLPFTNLSQDSEQEYFSDGITEDLITTLSRMSGLFVIARHSTFSYKGKAVKTAEVSRELGSGMCWMGVCASPRGARVLPSDSSMASAGITCGQSAMTGNCRESLPCKIRSHTRSSHLSL